MYHWVPRIISGLSQMSAFSRQVTITYTASGNSRLAGKAARNCATGCTHCATRGRSPTQIVQPVAQFLAAFPANLLFPVAVFGIVAWKLNPDVWLSPLMILGTQWYILFNVIAGASAMPSELRYAAQNLGVSGALWWRKVALPGVLPYYVTGAITASGGSWNAAIVAELASWRNVQVKAHGLGAYIAEATTAGDFHRIILGIATMSLFVVAINRVFWRPLYYFAERKYRLS